MRLRDLYKWEKGLPPWEERDSAEIITWIGEKEEAWEDILEKGYDQLSISGHHYDPFDTLNINAVLEPHDLFYGAGYAYSLKPTFFLAAIEDKREIDSHIVYTLGSELARDLLTIPALSQDNCILLRRESAKLFLWDHMLYIKKSGRPALRFALEQFGLKDQDPKTLKQHLATFFEAQKETYIYHEIGEINDTVFHGDTWREIIADYPHTPVELLARSLKDLLADTNEYGTLQHLMRKQKAAALGFYVAFFDGLAKEFFPELMPSFREFTKTGDWRIIEKTVSIGHANAIEKAEILMDIYQTGKRKNDKKWAEKEIHDLLLEKRDT